jgi:hypothetical protein
MGGGIGGGGSVEFGSVPDPAPPADVLTTRLERKLRYLGADRRMHNLILRDLYSVDDVVINMGKAFQFSLYSGRGYERPETPRTLRDVLVRTNLVF